MLHASASFCFWASMAALMRAQAVLGSLELIRYWDPDLTCRWTCGPVQEDSVYDLDLRPPTSFGKKSSVGWLASPQVSHWKPDPGQLTVADPYTASRDCQGPRMSQLEQE